MPRSIDVVEPDVKLGDALEPKPPAELVPHERHRALERADRRARASSVLADDAHPDPGVAQVGRRLDVGDGREPDARVRDLSRQERR